VKTKGNEWVGRIKSQCSPSVVLSSCRIQPANQPANQPRINPMWSRFDGAIFLLGYWFCWWKIHAIIQSQTVESLLIYTDFTFDCTPLRWQPASVGVAS